MSKVIKQLLSLVPILLLCVSVSAKENFWVLGSFASQTNADAQATSLRASLGVDVLSVESQVNGQIRYRLLVPEQAVMSADGFPENIGSPWLITLDESGQANDSTLVQNSQPVEPVFFLVGAFTDIDQALALERKLAEAALPVRGEAVLASGQVIHQVWVGPTDASQNFQTRLQTLGLTAKTTRPATAEEAETVKQVAPAIEALTAQKKPSDSAKQPKSNQYPKDFNLARLPEKRTSPFTKPN